MDEADGHVYGCRRSTPGKPDHALVPLALIREAIGCLTGKYDPDEGEYLWPDPRESEACAAKLGAYLKEGAT